jgi:hypothetical protein
MLGPHRFCSGPSVQPPVASLKGMSSLGVDVKVILTPPGYFV